MTILHGVRDFVAEFKARCRSIDRPVDETVAIMAENFGHYQIVKRKGETEKLVATGLTLGDVKTLLKTCKARLSAINKPNADGAPYFELEVYKVTVDGRERYKEAPRVLFDPDTKWIG